MAYLVTGFVAPVRRSLEACGFDAGDSGTLKGCHCLISYNGELYSMDGNFAINQTRDGIDAIGSGEEYALGALHILRELNRGMDPERMVHFALKAADYFASGVCPPFTILSTRKAEKGVTSEQR